MCAEIAQLVEQVIRNDQVVGSSPIFGTIKIKIRCMSIFFFVLIFDFVKCILIV